MPVASLSGCAAMDVLSSWAQLQQLGAGFWLRDSHVLTSMAERLAKQQFAVRRNADDCALLYCALGKRSVLQVCSQITGQLTACCRHVSLVGYNLHIL